MLGIVLAAALAGYGHGQAEPAPGVAPADVLADFQVACERDAGALWGVSLCGPLMIIDHDADLIVANAPDAGGVLSQDEDGFWRGRPDEAASELRANFAAEWSGVRWAVVQSYAGRAREGYLLLSLHESFHRIQPDLPFESEADMGVAGHLDKERSRVLFRVQLRALAEGLSTSDNQEAWTHFSNAAGFAASRFDAGEGALDAETALERHEGLAEYTAWKIAYGDGAADRFAQRLAADDGSRTYAGSFAYLSGPGLAFALDQIGPGWREELAGGDPRGLSEMLIDAINAHGEIPAGVSAGPLDYGLAEIEAFEAERAQISERRIASALARFIEGPTLRLPLGNMTFDPNTAFDLQPHGQVYEVITLSGDWGRIETHTGLLLHWSTGRAFAPAHGAPQTGRSESPDWVMEINPGWGWVRDGDSWAVRPE